MINLKPKLGLNVSLNKNNQLIFDDSALEVEVNVRLAKDMGTVLYDQSIDPEKPLYYMYRDVGYSNDKKLYHQAKLCFDITVLSPEPNGDELNKTKGHYHPDYQPGIAYPELYQVIYGQAKFLIQKPAKDESEIEKNYLIPVESGQSVIVPPNFGHVSINPGPTPLVMANVVNNSFESEYESYQEMKGASYYIFSDQIVKNPSYSKSPELIELKANEDPELGLIDNQPVYTQLKNDPTKLEYLSKPDLGLLSINKLFTK